MAIERSHIGWCDFSGGDANFVLRGRARGDCEVDTGCAHCYARRILERFGHGPTTTTFYPDKLRRLAEARFEENGVPFRRGPGSRPVVFPVDMGDLFHDAVPDEFILQALRVMTRRRDVDWALLTRRIARLARLCAQYYPNGLPDHVWPGVTVVDQATADERFRRLLQVRASVRWVNYEPALAALDVQQSFEVAYEDGWLFPPRPGKTWRDEYGIHWLVVGAESGPDRRPFDRDWARQVRDQCLAADVPFFYKQGAHLFPGRDDELDGRKWQEFPQ